MRDDACCAFRRDILARAIFWVYVNVAGITFDPVKSERNRERRGLPVDMVGNFGWTGAIIGVSRTQNLDTSTRFFAIGLIGRACYTVVFTFENRGIRVVSLRRSSSKERKAWHASRIPT